jgi:uncharacterized protein (TIGR02285 family)
MVKLLLGGFLLLVASAANSITVYVENQLDFKAYQSNTANGISTAVNLKLFENEQVTYQLATLKRAMQELSKDESACIVDRVKTHDRLAHYLFSKPTNLFLSRRLYQQKELAQLTAPVLTDDGVLLARLFAEQPARTLLVSSQVSFGEELDNQVAHLARHNKVLRDGGEQWQGMIKMFQLKRSDYALFFPQSLHELGVKLDAAHYAVAGTKPYVLGHIMCNQTDASKRFIAKLNQGVEVLFGTGELLRIHQRFMPSDTHQIVVTYLEQAFGAAPKVLEY